MNKLGILFSCGTHEEYAIKIINDLYGENYLIDCDFYGYELLENEGWIRLKISDKKISMYNELRKINYRQRKAIKDYALENNLKIIEDRINL